MSYIPTSTQFACRNSRFDGFLSLERVAEHRCSYMLRGIEAYCSICLIFIRLFFMLSELSTLAFSQCFFVHNRHSLWKKRCIRWCEVVFQTSISHVPQCVSHFHLNLVGFLLIFMQTLVKVFQSKLGTRRLWTEDIHLTLSSLDIYFTLDIEIIEKPFPLLVNLSQLSC